MSNKMFPILAAGLLFLLYLTPTGAQSNYLCSQDSHCQNEQTCSRPKTCSSSCSCAREYVGPYCEASLNDCGDHGEYNATYYVCVCKDNYWGEYCQEAPLCTSSGDCSDHGECVCTDVSNGPPAMSYTTNHCVCKDGYAGTYCDIAPVCTTHDDCGKGRFCNFGLTPYNCTCDRAVGTLNAVCDSGCQQSVVISLLITCVMGSLYVKL